MAPIKYEEQMKEKLEKRSLQPSPESWATLSKRLDDQQKGKSKSIFWWLGIAASIIGVVFVTSIYFNSNPIESDSQIIVDTEKNSIKEQEQNNINKTIEIPSKSNEMLVKESRFEEHSFVDTTLAQTNAIIKNVQHQEDIVQIEQTDVQNLYNSSVADNLTKSNASSLAFEEKKIQDVVAQINDLKSEGQVVSDAEIERLLKSAKKEILSNRLYNETTRTVDANALLQDVEADLEQSFRSKVFEALQSGYESVITAVVERNN